MENSVFFGKYIQKLFGGLIFSVLIALILFNLKIFKIDLSLLQSDSFSSFVQGITLIVGLIIMSILGLNILDIIVLLFQALLKYSYKYPFIRLCYKKIVDDDLFKSEGQIAKLLFDNYQEDILKWTYLKSWAQPEVFGNVKGLDKHLDKIREHILNLKSDELLVEIDYYSSVTQEQARKDQMRNRIKEYKHIIVNMLAVIILLNVHYLNFWCIIISTFSYLLFALFILNVIIRIKRSLAFYIINGYVDCFTLGESAKVIDRESNVE